MGLVKISEQMHTDLRTAAEALNRSINAQAEHWMRIGMLSELCPTLGHADISRLLLQAELKEGGLQAVLAGLGNLPPDAGDAGRKAGQRRQFQPCRK